MNKEYLVEKSLCDFYKSLYPNDDIVTQFSFPGTRFKFDLINHTRKEALEFDGYLHYTCPDTIFRDRKKDTLCYETGYTLIRWPYFVQLSKESISYFLGVDMDYDQTYPHGFIDKDAKHPGHFCYLGLKRYSVDMSKLTASIRHSICESLDRFLDKYKDIGYFNP